MSYENERNQLQSLYQQAKAELAGENLLIWAGGDAPNQQDALAAKFRERFPEVPITIQVDLSKFHNIRVYQELLDGHLTPDIVMLQTANDYENWRAMGALEAFQPESFAHLTPGYGDPNGEFLGAYLTCFVPQYAKTITPAPTKYSDFLHPSYSERLVLTPPHDDDAVLFVYEHIVRDYGREFLEQLAAQKPKWLRGTAAPAALVGQGQYLGNITGYMLPPSAPAKSFIPEQDFFIVWAQRAAMFRATRHKAAAKLFLAYITSHEHQSYLAENGSWSLRQDTEPPEGLKPLSEYLNTDPLGFIEWMKNREHIYELRNEMAKIFGPVQGESPLTDPALLKIVEN